MVIFFFGEATMFHLITHTHRRKRDDDEVEESGGRERERKDLNK
jgi:hypothetical protein